MLISCFVTKFKSGIYLIPVEGGRGGKFDYRLSMLILESLVRDKHPIFRENTFVIKKADLPAGMIEVTFHLDIDFDFNDYDEPRINWVRINEDTNYDKTVASRMGAIGTALNINKLRIDNDKLLSVGIDTIVDFSYASINAINSTCNLYGSELYAYRAYNGPSQEDCKLDVLFDPDYQKLDDANAHFRPGQEIPEMLDESVLSDIKDLFMMDDKFDLNNVRSLGDKSFGKVELIIQPDNTVCVFMEQGDYDIEFVGMKAVENNDFINRFNISRTEVLRIKTKNGTWFNIVREPKNHK